VLIFLKKHFPFVLCLFDAMQSEKVAEKSKKNKQVQQRQYVTTPVLSSNRHSFQHMDS